MTSINGQVGGFRKEVGYPKLPALLIASSLVLILEDVLAGRLNSLRTEVS